MKQKSILLLLALLFLLVPATSVQAAEDESFTVSYGKGYYFVNPLTGAEATGIFTGKIPASVTVKAGGSVTVAENTIVFRDYEFVAWEHKYTVMENGEEKTVTKRYSPGDTLENVTLLPIWAKDNEAVATHRVTYTTDEPGLTGELPASFELY